MTDRKDHILQADFFEKVAKKAGLSVASVKNRLYILKYKPAGRKQDRQYFRPFYTLDQVKEAVDLISPRSKTNAKQGKSRLGTG